MVYRKLDDHDLKDAIAHTEVAIQRALDLLKVVSGHPTIKGLSNVAESTPLLIEKGTVSLSVQAVFLKR